MMRNATITPIKASPAIKPAVKSNPVLIMFSASSSHSGNGEENLYILDIGGNIASTEREVTAPNGGEKACVAFQHYTTLSASEQTVKVQWKTSTSTATTNERALTVIEFKQN